MDEKKIGAMSFKNLAELREAFLNHELDDHKAITDGHHIWLEFFGQIPENMRAIDEIVPYVFEKNIEAEAMFSSSRLQNFADECTNTGIPLEDFLNGVGIPTIRKND